MRYAITLLIVMSTIAGVAVGEPADDKITSIPGYPQTFTNRAFGGYLQTSSDKRLLHYIFIESDKGAGNLSPVVLWLNGGPGCTSMIGFLSQISPYVLEQDQIYDTSHADLTKNPFTWLSLANLLFIDAPAGVGYSINNDPNYQYNDDNTAKDNLQALKYFFTIKFPEYAINTFYIAGESYGGKYIPDLSLKILGYNQNNPPKPINLKGILIANGAYNFQQLQNNRVEFMISHNFIDPRLIPYWERSCKTDSASAGCSYFYQRYEDLVYRIDTYNIYGQCYGRKGPPQKSLIQELSLRFSPFHKHSKRYGPQSNLQAGEWCSYDQGVQNYINANGDQLKSLKKGQAITQCNMTIFNSYKVDPKGSYLTIPRLLQSGLKVYLYSGDWDDAVPFTDNYKSFYKMGVKLVGNSAPWTVSGQHAGFIKTYTYGLKFYLVKGAGHEVPLYQRERSFNVFKDFLNA